MKGKEAAVKKAAYAILIAASAIALMLMVALQYKWEESDRYIASGRTAEVQPLTPMPADWLPNCGDASALDALPGIGEVLAERIIEYREAEGPFFFPEDMMCVKGIGETRFREIMEYLEEQENEPNP